jgi:hypothetical protein
MPQVPSSFADRLRAVTESARPPLQGLMERKLVWLIAGMVACGAVLWLYRAEWEDEWRDVWGSDDAATVTLGTQASSSPPSGSAAAPRSAASAKRPVSTEERAAAGDHAAMRKLEAVPARSRSAQSTLALAEGRLVKRRAELDAFIAEVRKSPNLLKEPERAQRLLDYARNRETTVPALRAIAELPGSIGPDMLYELWVATSRRDEVTELAEQLVYASDVRPKASSALAVALDLRKAVACEEYRAILPRAIEYGDRRSLRLVGKLFRTYGCGGKHKGDCFACLRDDDLLEDALDAVKTRKYRRFRKK